MSWELVDTEEKRLGLDPSKYTKKNWNPGNYANGNRTLSPEEVRFLREQKIAEQQSKILGESAISDEEYQMLKQRLIRGY